jgi:hypothetical protein
VEGRGKYRWFKPPLKLEVVASLEGIIGRFNPPLNLEVVASLNWRLTLLWKLLLPLIGGLTLLLTWKSYLPLEVITSLEQ